MSGASSNKAIWLSTAVSTANVAFTFIGLWSTLTNRFLTTVDVVIYVQMNIQIFDANSGLL